MGVFREDEKIGASKLILLWMAEGNIQYSDERGLEKVAEGYLMDLISSSLLMVSKTNFDGKVKSLQIHDLVRDFVLNKAKEEKFMQVIGIHNQYQPSYDGEHRVCIHLDHKLRRDLQTSNNSLDKFLTSGSKKETSFGQDLKSFFVTNNVDDFLAYRDFWNSECSFHGTISKEYLSRSYDLSSVGDLRLVSVLDFKNCILEDYEDILQSLVHVRYLRMCCEEFSFKWVSHLCNLETLLVDSNRTVEGTPHIWKMTKLKHVQILAILYREMIVVSEEGPSKLENLRTFEGMTLEVDSEEDIEVLIERFPNLQELTLVVGNDSGETKFLVLKFEVLTQLQSLFLHSMDTFVITKYYLPSSLKELILHQVKIPACAASTIAGLPNLLRLKFQDYCRFNQDEWDVRDVEFPVLKILKFRDVPLRQWHVSESSFPVLESLVLRRIGFLEKIPESFVDVETLTSIKVIHCKQNSLKASALEIKEEVDATAGCDNLDVYIFPPYSRITDDQMSEFKEAFSLFDQDEDGFITVADLRRVMANGDKPPTDEEVEEIIREADVDGDGRINCEEFVNYMMAMKSAEEQGSDEEEEMEEE
ncbi:PREDICTED: putative late blight resistance protein homolog R1A-10 isoform X1 [Nicotiana attenuata]|nr:PREDICTED: putative late blight resistance protein homolog R1A-10 isoform X1 [Nicotiana attenuata]